MNIKDLPQGSYKVLSQPTGQPLTTPPPAGGMLNIKDLPQNSYKVVSGQPVQPAAPKPFRYDIPVMPLPQEDRQTKIQRLQKESEVATKAFKKTKGFGGFVKELGGILASSEIALGNTIAKVSGDPTLNTATQNIQQLTDTNLRLIRQIRQNEKEGKDSTALKRQFNANSDIIEKNGGDISKYEAELPTNSQALGQVGGMSLDVLTAGTYSTAVKGMKTGTLAKETIPGLRVISRTVAPKVTKVADIASKTTGIFTKQGIKNVGKAASIGYGYDVTEGLQGNRGEDRMGANAFVPGAGTAISALLPGMTETTQSFKNRKLNAPLKIIEGRENELAQIEGNYQKLRKAQEYSQDANAAIRKEIASSDVLVGAVDAEGTIRTKQPGGAIDKYKKLTLDEAEDVVRKNLVRLDERVNLSVVEDELLKAIDESGLEGSDLRTALNGVKKEISGYRLKADKNGDVPLYLMHDAKISTTKNINYQTPPETKAYRKSIARGLKKVVENNSKFNTEEVNSVIAKYLKGIEYLENLDGRKVKGGRLGKYFAQSAGHLAGSMIGYGIGGPVGGIISGIVGGEVAGKLKGQSMARTFGNEIGRVPEKSSVLQKAIQQGNLPPEPITVNNYFERSRNGTQSSQYTPALTKSQNTTTIKSKVNNNSNIIVQNKNNVNSPPGQVARPADLKYNGPVKQGIVKVNNYQKPGYPSYRTPDQIKAETLKLEYKANKDKNFDIKRPLKAIPGSKMGQNGAKIEQGIQTTKEVKKTQYEQIIGNAEAKTRGNKGAILQEGSSNNQGKGEQLQTKSGSDSTPNLEAKSKSPEEIKKEYLSETWYHGSSKLNKDGDVFYSMDKEVAGDYGKTSKITNPAKNPLVVVSKDNLVDILGYDGDPFTEKKLPVEKQFDILAKKYAQSKGYDSILYEVGSFEAPELHVFKKELKPGIKSAENNLVAEARKYKSAEEFVNGQGDELYHGTSAKSFDKFEGDFTYLTPSKEEAAPFATNKYLGGGKGVGESRIIDVITKKGKIKDISDLVDETIMNGKNEEIVLKQEAAKARKEGYRYLEFKHPSTNPNADDFIARVSLYPKEDLATKSQLTDIWKKAQNKGTTQMFGAVAGVEVDEEGNVKFDVNKAIAGMAVLGISSNQLKVKELWKSWEKIQESKVGKSGSFIKAAEQAQKKIEELVNKLS